MARRTRPVKCLALLLPIVIALYLFISRLRSYPTIARQKGCVCNNTQTHFKGVKSELRRTTLSHLFILRDQTRDQLTKRIVNCKGIFMGDKEELNKADESHKIYNSSYSIPDSVFILRTRNCEQFKVTRGYITTSLTVEEDEFPLAFSILLYKDLQQTERLLRAIYRPHNYYCLHVDAKSSRMLYNNVVKLAGCFDNIFVASRTVSVYWGTFSVLEPELICMEDLLKRKGWKYFINLTGQEWPLRTNGELVKILKTFRGTNDIAGVTFSKIKNKYVKDRIHFIFSSRGHNTTKRQPPFKYNITLAKGPVHIAASRAFVDFAIKNPVAQEFQKWCYNTSIPDEHFFNSLHYSPQLGVPGAFIGQPPDKEITVARWKKWSNYKCHGKFVRCICIPGIRDLPVIYNSPELFMNKLHANYQPLVADCLEELYVNRTLADIAGSRKFDLTYYEQQQFIQNYRQHSGDVNI